MKKISRIIYTCDKNLYDVEKVLDKRIILRKHEYLVKWKGFTRKHNAWIPAVDVTPDLKRWFKAQKLISKVDEKKKSGSPKHGVKKVNKTLPLPKKKLKTINATNPEMLNQSTLTTPKKKSNKSLPLPKKKADKSLPLPKKTLKTINDSMINASVSTSELQINEKSTSTSDDVIQKVAKKLDMNTSRAKLRGSAKSLEKSRENSLLKLDKHGSEILNKSKDIQINNRSTSDDWSWKTPLPGMNKSRQSSEKRKRVELESEDYDFTLQISTESSELLSCKDSIGMQNYSVLEGTMQSPDSMIRKVAKKLDMEAYTPQTKLSELSASQEKSRNKEDEENNMLENDTHHQTSNASKKFRIHENLGNKVIPKVPTTFSMVASTPITKRPRQRKSEPSESDNYKLRLSNESSRIEICEVSAIMGKQSVLEGTTHSADNMVQKVAKKLDMGAYTPQSKLSELSTSLEKSRDKEDKQNNSTELENSDRQMSNDNHTSIQIFDDLVNEIIWIPSKFDLENTIPMKKLRENSQDDKRDASESDSCKFEIYNESNFSNDASIYQDSFVTPQAADEFALKTSIQLSKAPKAVEAESYTFRQVDKSSTMLKKDLEDNDERDLLGFDVCMSPVLL